MLTVLILAPLGEWQLSSSLHRTLERILGTESKDDDVHSPCYLMVNLVKGTEYRSPSRLSCAEDAVEGGAPTVTQQVDAYFSFHGTLGGFAPTVSTKCEVG